ncbi:uncharacterized protein LOC134752277 isoform X2 [Cydia strobilella]|uniref:uncharacterized protein LOC134752277 isoform X2 n=1 Tax=Cydia strobilella TaxID=1100964 RepID=UPI00300571A8
MLNASCSSGLTTKRLPPLGSSWTGTAANAPGRFNPRYQRIEFLKQHFWNRFSTEYISGLQQRTKWQSSRGKLDVGTMVVIKDKNLPPLMWLLGRIVQVLPGRDGIARVADIKTKKGVIRRAFNTICPLPIQDLEDPRSSTPGVYVGDKPATASN